jgi:glutamate racemase
LKFGFYDSGIGGLITLREIVERVGCFDVLYLADTANFPYGDKEKEELFEIGRRGVSYLFERGVDVVVVACNTLSTTVGENLKKEFEKPVILITDFLEGFDVPKNSFIIGTKRTVESGFYQRKLGVSALATPKLAQFVEMGIWEEGEVEEYLKEILPEGFDFLILACTHYTVLKGTIRKIKPNLGILDISELFADYFARIFKVLGSGGKIKVFLTGKGEKYPELISALKFPCSIELV